MELSVSDEHEKESAKKNMAITVRDESKGLIQKAGIGASVRLAETDPADKPKIVSLLKYPKNCLDILWGDSKDLHTNAKLLVRVSAYIMHYVFRVSIECFRFER